MRWSLAPALLVAAVALHAEQPCGRMERFATTLVWPPGIPAMQAVWLECDGELRRVEELVLAAARDIEVYDGWIDVGHVYRAEVVGQALEPFVSLPRHHTGGYSWTNAHGLLPDDGQRRTVVFEVPSQSIEYFGERTWLNLSDLRIREVR